MAFFDICVNKVDTKSKFNLFRFLHMKMMVNSIKHLLFKQALCSKKHTAGHNNKCLLHVKPDTI